MLWERGRMRNRAFRLCAIFGGLFAVFAVLRLLFPLALFLILAITFGTVFYHYAMRVAAGELSARTYQKPLDPNGFWFRQKSWEPGLYRRLRVRQWKNKLPTYAPDSYSLQKRTPEQIIRNTCHAELVHEAVAALSFLPVLLSPWLGAFPVFLVTSTLAACSDLVFAVLQRYNRPRLQRLLEKSGKK